MIRNPKRTSVTSPVSAPISTWTQFSPLAFQPLLWLDADDPATITSSGGYVSEWSDKSGNGRNAVQATSANQPQTGIATRNGRNVISFTAANSQYLETVSGYSPAAYGVTAFFVTAAGANGNQVFSQKDLNGVGRFWMNYVPTGGNNTFLGNTATGVYPTTITTQVLHTIVCKLGTSQPIQFIRNKNAQIGTGTITLEASDGAFRVGSNKAVPPSVFYQGQIAEIILYSGAITYGRMVQVWDYLNAKWAVF